MIPILALLALVEAAGNRVGSESSENCVCPAVHAYNGCVQGLNNYYMHSPWGTPEVHVLLWVFESIQHGHVSGQTEI